MRLQHSPIENSAASLSATYFSLSSLVVAGSSIASPISLTSAVKFLIARMICAVPRRSNSTTSASLVRLAQRSSMATPSFWYIVASFTWAWSLRRRIFSTLR